ncbi:MAG: alpha/beta fold hydrolase [Acidimicrobiia bacterium]|nr:alpha/beta fold hydrolase [Acidimicrobiia bacterium]
MGSTEFRTIHGHQVAYRTAGNPDDPVVVLIHGMAGSSRTWRDCMDTLADGHYVVAPDLLGHGRSDKPAGDYSLGNHASLVRDFLINVGVERATIVGQSLGGGVAMQFAYQYPEVCERLTLVNSGGLGRDVNLLLRLLSLPGAELVLPIAVPGFVRDRGNEVSRWMHRNGIRPPRVAEMWQAYASLAEPATRTAFLRTLRSVVDPGGQSVSARDRLYLAAAVPTLIVWGDADPIIPVHHGTEAHEAMPGSRLEVFEGVGHFPHVEVPDLFAATLLDFLRTTEPAFIDADHRRRLLVGDDVA